jgi:hypothetical protein
VFSAESARSEPTSVADLEAGRRFAASVAAYNVFDSHDNDITYFHASRSRVKPRRWKTAIFTPSSRARCD